MQTHRVLHDLSELSHEDIGELDSNKTSVQHKPYQFIFAALAVGLLLGFFIKRK